MKTHYLINLYSKFYIHYTHYFSVKLCSHRTVFSCLILLACVTKSFPQNFTTIEIPNTLPGKFSTNYSITFLEENETRAIDPNSSLIMTNRVDFRVPSTDDTTDLNSDPTTPTALIEDVGGSNPNPTKIGLVAETGQIDDKITRDAREDISVTPPIQSDPVQIDSGIVLDHPNQLPAINLPVRVTHFNDELLGIGPFTKEIDEGNFVLDNGVRNPVKDLVIDSAAQIVDQVVINGAEAVDKLGNWIPLDTDIVALSRRGHVEYDLPVPSSGIFLLKIDATQNVRESRRNNFKLLIYIDDEYIGRKYLSAEYGKSGQVTCVTPWLSKVGSHRMRIFWDNVYERTSLRIKKVTLQQTENVASSFDGATGWVKTALTTLNVVDKAPSESITSPVCIEGLSRFSSRIEVTTNDGIGPVTAQQGVGDRWFADVPLSPMNPTLINTSFEDGAYNVEKEIEWVPTNIFESSDLVIRKGDALLLTAASPNVLIGSVTIEVMPKTKMKLVSEVDGEITQEIDLNAYSDQVLFSPEGNLSHLQKTDVNHGQEFFEFNNSEDFPSKIQDFDQPFYPVYETSVQEPIPHIFNETGVFEVMGTHSLLNSQATGKIRVTVICAPETTPSPAVWKDRERQWDWDGLPEQAVVEAAWPLAVKEINSISDGGKSFNLIVERAERDPFLVARLGGDGPILSTVKVDAFWLRSGVEGRIRRIESSEEGNAVYTERIFAWGLPPTVDLCLEALTSGVYLGGEDVQLARTVTRSHFNELGEYPYELITVKEDLPTCHKLDVYQDGFYIGSRRKLF